MDSLCQRLAAELTGRRIAIENEAEYLNSAVLVPIIRRDNELHILFEVRSASLNRQPGEICFPGGRIEAGETAGAAAVRETAEEIGIAADSITLLGPLNYVVSPIGVILHPFAGCLADDTVLHPDPREVAELFTVPLPWLLSHEPQEGHMEVATRPLPGFPLHLLPPGYPADWKQRKSYPVLFYRYGPYVIWGLTARILATFVKMVRETGIAGEGKY